MINVLILSAGRRVELIQRFKSARDKLHIDGKVVAVDVSNMAPALYFADKFYLIPSIKDKQYIPSIIDICKKEKIDLIVPTIDTELLELAENKEKIESNTDAKISLSDRQVIKICRDKNNSQTFFEKNDFGVPKCLTREDIEKGNYSFPLFIKPKDGSSSINAFKINKSEELEFFLKYVDSPMVQEYIKGKEFSVDVFCDFESNPITIVPRERISMRSGEIAKGIIRKDREIIDDVRRLIGVLKPIGHITIQCIKSDEGIKYIEINPRFGGGAPMSIDAGADSCANLYRLLRGEKLSYNEDYKDGILFLRFDSSIMLNENMELYDD